MVTLHDPERVSHATHLNKGESLCVAKEYRHSGRHSEHDLFLREDVPHSKSRLLASRPTGNHQHRAYKSIDHVVQDIEWPKNVAPYIVVQSAWAILLSWYGESAETAFGIVVRGNEDPVSGTEPLAGKTTIIIPVRVAVESCETLKTLEQQIRQQAIDSAPVVQAGRQDTRHLNEEADLDWQSRSVLTVQITTEADDPSASKPIRRQRAQSQCKPNERRANEIGLSDSDDTDLEIFDTYAITLHCQVRRSSLLLRMVFNASILSEQVAIQATHHFDHILRQICRADSASTKINDLDVMSTEDLRRVWNWNAKVPEATHACVHDLFAESVRRYHHRPAICAWDGELNYEQMDSLSTQLSHRLIHMGVRPGDVLPLCFEKSMWMPVTQFAVMKAGAASMGIDPSQPKERIKTMTESVESGLILCAPSTTSLIYSITGRKPFVVENETVANSIGKGDEESFETILPHVKPSDLLYVVFTSGTTGVPKGAMITHSNAASAVQLQRDLLHITPTSRVANFCSYAWDVAWSDLIHTLAAGACLCIPSEYTRKHDLVDFMIKKQVTWVELTPSVAAILELNAVPTLDTVILLGELVDFDKLPHLRGVPNTIITYGPTECTVTATGVVRNFDTAKASIGWACGATTWVVDPNGDALTPVGLCGELLVEGPLVGRGYLNNAEKTAASFIEDPSWLLRGGPGMEGRRGRLYRTRDLVRYNDDGQLIYLGRKDSQVKINGHRTELGDVEHHICRVLEQVPTMTGAVAEVVTPKATQRPILVAFLLMSKVSADELGKQAASIIETVELEMSKRVPSYMVPGVYIPISELPMTSNGKTDRRALQKMGATLNPKSLASLYATKSAQHIEPSGEPEKQLREVWASILNLPVSDIGAEDHFVRLGGDSVAAMRLVAAVRREGKVLTVPDIFGHPRLREMANLISQSELVSGSMQSFSLLKTGVERDDVCRQAAELCYVSASQVGSSQIEDIFPCTALQEGLLAMTARSPGKYVSCQIAELKDEVDLVRFQEAWQTVSERASVLRTRIVDLPGQGLVQVVIAGPLQWQTYSSLNEYRNKVGAGKDLLENGVQTSMGLGAPLSHLGIINDGSERRQFALTQHHAIYDGWSMPMLQREVEKAYRNERGQLSSLPLQGFVKHMLDQYGEAATAFWKRKFAGVEASQFPALPNKTYQPEADKLIIHSISSVRWPTCGVTPSSALRTAWATLVSWYVSSPDVAFGAVVSGRQAPIPGIEDIAGPTIATVPVRVLVRGTIDELLHQVQQQAMEMVPFEQYGLQHIRQISQDANHACDFQTLLLIHSPVEASTVDSPVFKTDLDQQQGLHAENSYAMMLTCQMSESSLHMQLSFDSSVVKEECATRLFQQLEHILGQIGSVSGSTEMGQLYRVSERDLKDIWQWNATVPNTVVGCVHSIFAERVSETPDAIAVCAWDGELTYGQLHQAATLLASHFVSSELKIGPGVIVPLYFEKPLWVPVAILAVMQAGAASVLLDSTLPRHRLKSIVSQLSASVILTSKSCAKLAAEITDAPKVEVGGPLNQFQRFQPIRQLPTVSPSSTLYIVFTSGSTGAPKGAIITHANFCSAIRHHQQELGLERSSRVFDYTSYSFDVAWSNVLHTLTIGACLCIPSEYERTADINGTIHRLRADFIHLTPTVGRSLDPATLKGLKKVLFIGEALKASDVARWKTSGAEIYNTYGPAECTVTSTVENVHPGQVEESGSNFSGPGIGKGVGALAWVVQPSASDMLAAIGTVGELWLEGPIVGAGYLDNAEITANAFVEDPKWLLRGIPERVSGRRGRLYRTDDLVYYKPDGSLGFIGRKDTQVKINGQRLELGEVEYHVRQMLPVEAVSQIVADVIIPDATQSQTLAIFLAMFDDTGGAGLVESTALMIANLRKELLKRLPSYMVPSAYIPLAKLPMTATGKTDRQKLHELGKAYNPLALLSSNASTSVTMLTDTARTLRDIWARLLDIESDLITADQHFSDVGGDSIKTMSLAMAIRKHFNISIGVPQLVRQHHSLHELANLIDSLLQGQHVEEPTPINLEQEVEVLVSKIQCDRPASVGTVFLTGSTRFLGTQILRHALTKRAFGKVVVLVRSLHAQKGLDRVRQAAKLAGWWKDSFASAIEVWDGDLSAERLGLNDSQWDALSGLPSTHGTIDAIIHNGAVVHWSTSYDQLKDVNVGSTVQLLQAAMISPFVRSFVYVSGGLITDSRNWTKEEEKQASGYDQTKYVSERLVSAAAAKSRKQGTKFSVVKPGQIIGDAYTGIANTDDFLWRVVMCATRLGARPVESETSWLSVSDVRHVTETILWHATDRRNEDFVHIRRGIWVNSFWAALEDQLKVQLRPVTWDEWIGLARQDMAEEQELHPLWPVQQFLGALGTKVADDVRCDWEMQEFVAAARQNIEYLRDKGLTQSNGNHGRPINGSLITRTGHTKSIQVLPAEDTDMERLFEIVSLANARNEPILDAMFPSHWTAAGRQAGGERMRLAKNSDPHAVYLKAVDNSTGEIVGAAKWYVLDNVIPDASAVRGSERHFFESAADWAYFTRFVPLFLERRNAAITRTRGNVVGLDTLSVHPAHQRKKVGDALVKWGTRKADAMGVETIVESSVAGRGLYEKNGFVFQEDCEVQVPEVVDRPPGKFAWLIRPKQAEH